MTGAVFGATSRQRLAGVDSRLRAVMERVVAIRDISIVCGVRSKADQDKAFEEGKSKLRWPNGKHNIREPGELALAVDIVPWPEQYSDPVAMTHVAGIVKGVAAMMDVPIRWGGDWNRNNDLSDDPWDDIWHFEIEDETISR